MPYDIAAAHKEMVAKLSTLFPPRISTNPCTDQFEAVTEYLLDVARIVDHAILTVGRHVDANATTKVDLGLFTNPLRDALEGNATHAIYEVIEVLREDAMENA